VLSITTTSLAQWLHYRHQSSSCRRWSSASLVSVTWLHNVVHHLWLTTSAFNVVFVRTPKSVTNKLQRVLNVAAWVVSGTRKFDRGLTQLLHADLHLLDVPECIRYKLCMMELTAKTFTWPLPIVLLFLAVFSKHSFSQSTSALEALAMMRYINLHLINTFVRRCNSSFVYISSTQTLSCLEFVQHEPELVTEVKAWWLDSWLWPQGPKSD